MTICRRITNATFDLGGSKRISRYTSAMDEQPKAGFWRLQLPTIGVLALGIVAVVFGDLLAIDFHFEKLAFANPGVIVLFVALECVPVLFAALTTELLARHLVRIHLSTALGLLFLLGFLMHLNITPTTVWIAGDFNNYAETHFGWPFCLWNKSRNDLDLLSVILDPIAGILLLAAYVFAYEHWIRWSTKAGKDASRKFSTTEATLSRLKVAKEQSTTPGDGETPQ